MRSHLAFLIVLTSLLFTSTAISEIYKWTDEHGNVYFTDRPPPNQKTEIIDVKINSYTSPKIIDVDKLFGKTNTLVMYSATWCGYCKKARNYFKSNNIAFKEYDVENTSKGQRDYEKLGGDGVPIILMGKKRMNGFSAKKFERFYKSNKQEQLQQ